MAQVDVSELRDKVKAMYQAVAEEPHGRVHFETGGTWPVGWATGRASRRPR